MRKLLFKFVLFLASTAGAQKLLYYDLVDDYLVLKSLYLRK